MNQHQCHVIWCFQSIVHVDGDYRILGFNVPLMGNLLLHFGGACCLHVQGRPNKVIWPISSELLQILTCRSRRAGHSINSGLINIYRNNDQNCISTPNYAVISSSTSLPNSLLTCHLTTKCYTVWLTNIHSFIHSVGTPHKYTSGPFQGPNSTTDLQKKPLSPHTTSNKPRLPTRLTSQWQSRWSSGGPV
jgi:hypothetical protein